MTKGNPLPIILQFTLPLMIGNVFQQIYNAVDSMIVGRFVGANALAAVGSTGTIMFMVRSVYRTQYGIYGADFTEIRNQ